MKQIITFLFVVSPFFMFAQNWQIGGSINYGKGNLKPAYIKELIFNKSVNEYNAGVTATKFFKKKIGIHLNIGLNNLWLVDETEDIPPFSSLDPEKDIKYSLNYLNANVKLLYYKNNTVDGISFGLGSFIYLFQTKNYDIIYDFEDHYRLYNIASIGYYCYPFKNFMAELEFVGNITALGDFTFGGRTPKWEDKYWKYGLRVSVTYNFLSLPKKNKQKDK